MLKDVNPSEKLKKADYRAIITDLEYRMGGLQRAAKERGIPTAIVFEGWGASGKGTLINRLILCLDPRGFKVHSTRPATEEERLRPFLWRFWTRTPPIGRVAIFDRSWYSRFLVERMDGAISKSVCERSYEEVNNFERQLSDGGTVIIKFFLHITKDEQTRRFNKLEANPSTSWRVTDYDWKKHDRYKELLDATEEMLNKTDTEVAPWHIIPAHDWRYATVEMLNTVVNQLESHILRMPRQRRGKKDEPKPGSGSILDDVDHSLVLAPTQYQRELKKYQTRLQEIQNEVYTKRIPVLILYEGWDAAGKGGNIRRLVRYLDPRGYEVIPVAAPNDIEKEHHYLWRFWQGIPKAGHFAIFDRSWYGRVLVERVEGFCTKTEWQRAYREINEMEEHLANSGTAIIKFWMEIDKEEQLARFRSRERLPYKRWKITEDDWRNREKWDRYKETVEEMLHRTDSKHAPWTVVESNDKRYARIKVMKTVVKELERHL